MIIIVILVINLLLRNVFITGQAPPGLSHHTQHYQINKMYANNNKAKIKFSKGRILYYDNHISTFNVILQAGDVEQNPGPGSHKSKDNEM